MALLKFASVAIEEAWLAPGSLPLDLGRGHRRATAMSRLPKTAHRHKFEYAPRKGYLYVRSRAISSRMNDNFDLFPAEEIRKAWPTFIGKPVFVNHRNEDHKRARGVIIDAALHEDVNPDGTPDTWVEVLMEVDAVRFPKLAKAILAGHVDRTSMGTNVEHSQCTACGNIAATPADYCSHIPRLKGMKLRRKRASGVGFEEVVIAEKCVGLSFFENSLLVEEPADPTAFFLGVDDRGLQTAATKQSILLHEKGPWTEEDERKHPRKSDGEFTEKGKGEESSSTEKKTPAEGPAEGSAAEAPASSTKWQSPNTTGTGTKADPIATDNVEDAARALIQGHHVELKQPRQVSTLVDRLAEEIHKAKESGSKLAINLCNVTAKGTNIFCVEAKGIPRIKMPQLKSKIATPGSRATQEIQPNEWGEYDLQPAFLQSLRAAGFRTSDTEVLASHLKATQSELNTEKIAGMMDKVLGGGALGDEPIFVSNDDYIVDGHHRWAATIAADYDDGQANEMTLPIHVIDMDIITLLAKANKFAEEWGLPAQGVTARRLAVLRMLAARLVPVNKIRPGDVVNMPPMNPKTVTKVEPIAQFDVDGNSGTRIWFEGESPAGMGFRNTDVLSVQKPGGRGLSDQQMTERWPSNTNGKSTGPCPVCDKAITLPNTGARIRPHNFGRSSSSPCPASGKTTEEAYAYMDEQRRMDRQRQNWAPRIARAPGAEDYGWKGLSDERRAYMTGFDDGHVPEAMNSTPADRGKGAPRRNNPYAGSGSVLEQAYDEGFDNAVGWNSKRWASRRTAHGEQVAPPEVDTLRDEECPVCGSNESYNGEKCLVCGYLTPPDMFQDPDLTKAQDVNLRQDDAASGAPAPADEPLECNTCGATFGDEAGVEPAAEVPEDAEVDPNLPDPEADDGAPMDLDPGDPAKKFPEGTHTDDEGDTKAEKPDDESDEDDEDDEKDKKKPPFKPKGAKIDPFERLQEGDAKDSAGPEIGLKAGDSCPKCGEGTLEPSGADPGVEPVEDGSTPDQGSIEDARVGAKRGTHMANTLKAIAAQQRRLDAQDEAIRAIARLAGLDGHPAVIALQRVADAENPAQPEPEPAAEAPVLVPSIPQGTTEVTTPGSSPVTDVAPDATTSLTDPGGVLTDVGPDATADVQAPVTGTQEGADNTVETEVVSETGDNTSTMFPLEGGPFAQKASSQDTNLRQIASMRLARLRIRAGIAQSSDDLVLAAAIARDANLSDHDIETEVATLNKVMATQAQRQPAQQARTAGVRSVPSFAGMPPVVAAEGPPGDDAFLFAD